MSLSTGPGESSFSAQGLMFARLGRLESKLVGHPPTMDVPVDLWTEYVFFMDSRPAHERFSGPQGRYFFNGMQLIPTNRILEEDDNQRMLREMNERMVK